MMTTVLALRGRVFGRDVVKVAIVASLTATMCIITFNNNLRLVNPPTATVCYLISFTRVNINAESKPLCVQASNFYTTSLHNMLKAFHDTCHPREFIRVAPEPLLDQPRRFV